jgi:MFS family permease
MNAEKDTPQYEFKSHYFWIFLFFYLIEGMHQTLLPIVLPVYLADLFGGYDIALFTIIISSASIPWALKFLVGIINDKWGSKRFGRRFPFIIIFGSWSGIWWIIMALTLPADESIYFYCVFTTIINNIGFAVADTALDGLILDVTPKDKLGKVQGYTWTFLLLGGGVAGVLFFLLYGFLFTTTLPVMFIIIGISSFVCCIFPFFVKESKIEKDVDIFNDFKFLITKRKNWIMFSYSFVDRISEVIIFQIYAYLILVSMGLIGVEKAILSLIAGQSIDLFIWYVIFLGSNGIGTIIGSIITSKIADKSRKKAVYFSYIFYIPFCIVCNWFIGMILGISGEIIFGIAFGAITVSGQTIRGDYTRRNFPDLKSTYYALLISFSNLGLAFSGFLSAGLISWFATFTTDFYLMHFLLTIACAIILTLSFLIFLLIDPKDYEFESRLELVSDESTTQTDKIA